MEEKNTHDVVTPEMLDELSNGKGDDEDEKQSARELHSDFA